MQEMNKDIDVKKLEKHIHELVRAQGSPNDVSVVPVSGAKSINANINYINKKISCEIPYDWNPLQYENIAEFARRLRIRKPRTKICEDIGFHEVGHNKLKHDKYGLGCPEDMQGKEIAVDAVAKAMLEQNRFSQDGALYMENCISDIINNLNCSQYTHLNGLSMFFAEQGELNQGKYSPLYEAFVKLNMHMSGRKKQKQMLKKYYTDDKTVDEAVENCLRDIGLKENREHNVRLLFNKPGWPETFYMFAKNLVKLMKSDAPEFLPGSGSGGKGYKVPVSFEEHGKFNPEDVDDPLMKKVLDNDNLKKIMQRRNNDGCGIPTFIEQWRALDYFYQGQASELYIKAETPKKGESMPIAPIQAKSFDADKDTLDKILFGRILLDEKGKPCLAVPRSYVEHNVKYKKSIISYPELNIAVLDNSISMMYNSNNEHDSSGKPINVGRTNIVPWGDNSKYHYALLTYYGIEKAMHRMGVGTRTRYNMVTFSTETKATGEKSYEEKMQIKKRILNPTFGNDTEIDIGVLAKCTREAGSILMTISDGEIFNWDKIKGDFRRIISDKFYVHFQIGDDSQTTRDLESWGAEVIKIKDASQMPRKAIDITQSFYKSYA